MKKEELAASQQKNESVFYSPWEKTFTRFMTPFDQFIKAQTSSSLLLIVAVMAALILANSPAANLYQKFLHVTIGFHLGGWALSKSLQHWVNDGLMALFFFLVGLELKREILVGELASLRQALLPLFAAAGGMLVPALFYYLLNQHGAASRGWAIPMATDIVFALSVLILLGQRIPKALFTFLVAVAIVDDIGAIIVIAVFYSKQIVFSSLGIAAILTVLLFLLNRIGVRKSLPYSIVGIILWYFLLKSGVHATLAGVITAFSIPAKPRYSPSYFSKKIKELVARFDKEYEAEKHLMTNAQLSGVVQTLENSVHQVETPLQRIEHKMHRPVAFLIIPVFAFCNAGIPFQLGSLVTLISHPIVLGIMSGLVLGKFLGVFGACWLALKLGITRLPEGMQLRHIAGVGLLSGIGFTMSIFIAELSFTLQPQYLLMAKSGILFASVVAGTVGFTWLWIIARKNS